ncbi:MAG: hypothetical protein HQ582_29855, partial [Planctomycetes bacterium]|nr:hypothetical protein [Planctomycetota bacterium]
MSLVNYEVRDQRIDESLMYMPAIREKVDGAWDSSDPYIKEHNTHPEIRPPLPTWIGYLLYVVGGGSSGCVLLLHTVFPALGGVLLVRFFRTFVSPRLALALALAGVGTACYSLNRYLTLFHLLPLQSMDLFCYNPERGLLFGDCEQHLWFNRFMSPGITLPPLLVTLCALGKDPDLRSPRLCMGVGLLWGAQLYVYPHGFVFLGMLLGTILLLRFLARPWDPGKTRQGPLAGGAVRAGMLMGVPAMLVSVPFAVAILRFRGAENAGDVLLRVGYCDTLWKTLHPPVYLWLAMAVWFKTLANRSVGRKAWQMMDTPEDRLWLALVVVSSLGCWMASMLGTLRLFPQPWLIPSRIVCFILPVVVAWPLVIWARNEWSRTVCRWSARTAAAGFVLYALLLASGEIAAGMYNSPHFAITDAMHVFRQTVEQHTKEMTVIMTDDLKLVSFLVNETNRYSFVGYGISSNASNEELTERLMIPCVVQGKDFREFLDQHWEKGFGLPEGPAGKHWIMHHGSENLNPSRERLEKTYQELVGLHPAEALSRY